MEAIGQLLVLVLWLFSQPLGFFYPVSPLSPGWDARRYLPLAELQTGICNYDAGIMPVDSDIALPPAKMAISAHLNGCGAYLLNSSASSGSPQRHRQKAMNMSFFKHKKLSRDELVAIAQRISEQNGWQLLEPVHVQSGLFAWTVVSNYDSIGCNIRVKISKHTGEPIQWSFIAR